MIFNILYISFIIELVKFEAQSLKISDGNPIRANTFINSSAIVIESMFFKGTASQYLVDTHTILRINRLFDSDTGRGPVMSTATLLNGSVIIGINSRGALWGLGDAFWQTVHDLQ